MSELSQEARALIDSVSKLDNPSAEDRTRVKQRLALSLGATAFTALAVTTQVANGAGTGLFGGFKAGLFGSAGKLALCAGVLGGALVVSWPSGQARPKLAQRESAEASTVKSAAVDPAAPHAPLGAHERPSVQTPLLDAERAKRDVHAGLSAGRRAAALKGADQTAPEPEPQAGPEKSALAHELLLLAEAQAALRAGHPERALVLAEQHRTRFPGGVLREERQGIEVLSECDLGRKSAGHAEAFLRAAPGSPLAARVRKACGLE